MNDNEQIYIHGHIDRSSIFWGIFPNNKAPLYAPIAILPDAVDAPLCYLVDGAKLDEPVIEALADIVLKYAKGRGKPKDREDAIDYIRGGLPIEAKNCSSVSFNDPKWIPVVGWLPFAGEDDESDDCWGEEWIAKDDEEDDEEDDDDAC